MIKEKTDYQNRTQSRYTVDKKTHDDTSISAEFDRLKKERKKLDEEKKRIMEIKKLVERGRAKLKGEIENTESLKQELMEKMQRKMTAPVKDDTIIEREKEKIAREWDQIGKEEKKLHEDREKLDILFEDISNRKFSLDRETRKVEKEKAVLDEKEKELRAMQEKLEQEKVIFDEERTKWNKEYSSKMAEISVLPEKKAEIDLENENLKLERLRLEKERRFIEDEKKVYEHRREMVDEEQKILEEQRKIIEEQKKRILETSGLTPEVKYALETPIPKPREIIRVPISSSRPTAPPKFYDVGIEHLDRTRYLEQESNSDNRLKALEEKIHPHVKKKKKKKSMEKTEKSDEKLPTMTCLSCGKPVPIPPGSTIVKCPGCGREYKIKERRKKIKSAVKKPAPSSVKKSTPTHVPTTFTSVLPEDTLRTEAKIVKRNGKYFTNCLNPSCKAEVELANPYVKRFHCPNCGRRNKVARWEG